MGTGGEGQDAAPPPPALSQGDSTLGSWPLGLANIAENATISTGTEDIAGRGLSALYVNLLFDKSFCLLPQTFFDAAEDEPSKFGNIL